MLWKGLLQVCSPFKDLFFWAIFLVRASKEDPLFLLLGRKRYTPFSEAELPALMSKEEGGMGCENAAAQSSAMEVGNAVPWTQQVYRDAFGDLRTHIVSPNIAL